MAVIKGKERKLNKAIKTATAAFSRFAKKKLKRRQDTQPVQGVAGAP